MCKGVQHQKVSVCLTGQQGEDGVPTSELSLLLTLKLKSEEDKQSALERWKPAAPGVQGHPGLPAWTKDPAQN